MAVINIRKAQREGARLVVGLAGISGSGKTRTAIELGYGLAAYNPEKLGFLDTENKRGSLYADVLKEHPTHPANAPFWIGDLYSPFSPERYTQAILEFQKAGVEVLVIDSVSHEWEGQGGCEEIAESRARGGMKDWATAKREHKKFMNALLASDMHIIVCIRAREKVEISKQKNPESGKIETVVEPRGIQPICEKNFMFEMTASLMMWDEGKAQQVMKCPSDLRAILGREDGYITSADGKTLRDWVDGAKQLDPEVEAARNTLRTTTERGMEAVSAQWAKTPKRIQKILQTDGTLEELRAAAKAFDADRTNATNDGGAGVDDINNQVLGNSAQSAA